MQDKRRGILSVIIAIICISMLNIMAYAEGTLEGQVIDGSLLTNQTKSEVTRALTTTNPEISLYGKYLSYGTVGIANLGNRRVNFYGDTTCYRQSDEVTVDLYLQRLINGNWMTYTTRYCTEYNSYLAGNGDTISVTGGYYYRVKGVHSATKGSTVETAITYSDGVYIS